MSATITAPGYCTTCGTDPDDGDRPGQFVNSPESAARIIVPKLCGHDRERAYVLVLTQKHEVIDTALVSIGTVSQTFLTPREVMRDVLMHNGAAFIVGHNHPSGDPEPSPDDLAITRRLSSAATLMGVDLLDHLVVGGTRWVSLARRGALGNQP